MAKRIGSTAWRVSVVEKGDIFSLGVRSDVGLEYEVLLGSVDSTPMLTDLLNEMARTHKDQPSRTFKDGDGPNHPRSVPVKPLSTRVEKAGETPVLVLDFGGTVLKVEIDPAQLKQALEGMA